MLGGYPFRHRLGTARVMVPWRVSCDLIKGSYLLRRYGGLLMEDRDRADPMATELLGLERDGEMISTVEQPVRARSRLGMTI